MIPQVSFKGMEASPALAADIQEKIEHVERITPTLSSCRVLVEAPHRKRHNGFLYHVVIQAALPGREIVVGKNNEDQAHADPFVAVRDAFLALRRQLEELR